MALPLAIQPLEIIAPDQRPHEQQDEAFDHHDKFLHGRIYSAMLGFAEFTLPHLSVSGSK